jgi:hypothetical protein
MVVHACYSCYYGRQRLEDSEFEASSGKVSDKIHQKQKLRKRREKKGWGLVQVGVSIS